jgi:hypothetical protein
MPWNFFKHPVEPEEAIEAQDRREGGSKRPLEEIRREKEMWEMSPWETTAGEATREVGGVAVDLHGGSRAMARSPEKVLLGRNRERE